MLEKNISTKQISYLIALLFVVFGSSRIYKNHSFNRKEISENNISKTDIALETEKQSLTKIEKGETTLTLGYGGNVVNLLTSFGAEKQEAQNIANKIYEHVNAKSMKSGQCFTVKFTKIDGSLSIDSLEMQPDLEKKLFIEKNDSNFKAKVEKIKLTSTSYVYEGKIGGSFYTSAIKAGVSADIIKTSVELLSYVVNFQHGIKSGASFKILTDALKDPNGKIVKITGLRFIELNTGINNYKLFAFDDGRGIRFYNEKGESVARSLLQTPVQMTRPMISSGFGTRVHPCLGYTREHKGVDFAAPTGTPVLAAGEGKVVFAGWNGSYGKLVHIVHGNGYETKYAHLKSINKEIKPGARVTQRQIIGGVGTTGMSTGPHLHFEVILNKKHINPMKVSAMPIVNLTGSTMKKFETAKNYILQQCVNQKKEENTISKNLQM